jgi:hypothetical protein
MVELNIVHKWELFKLLKIQTVIWLFWLKKVLLLLNNLDKELKEQKLKKNNKLIMKD